jgi:hypothetical protein
MAGSRLVALPTTIADHLIINPTASRADIAEYFQISYSTVCNVVRSNMFEALLQERKAALVSAAMGDVYDTAAAVTEQALERLSVIIATNKDPEFLLAAVAQLMDRTVRRGGSEGGMRAPLVHVSINAEDLAEARARMTQAIAAPPRALLEGETVSGD